MPGMGKPGNGQTWEFNQTSNLWQPVTVGSGATTGLAANRPSPTGSGKLYFCTDIPVAYFDNPNTSLWQQFFAEYMPAPPAASNFTITPANSLSITNYADALRVLNATNNSNTNCALIPASGQLNPTAAWTVTLVATFLPITNSDYPDFGVGVSNGTTSGTSTIYGLSVATNGYSPYIHQEVYTIGGGRSQNNNEQSPASPWFSFGNGRIHLRILNDTYAMRYQVSNDGFNWLDWYSTSSVSGLTDYGIWMAAAGGSVNYSQVLVYSLALGTPTQYNVTGATNASPSVITIGTHSILPGDLVSVTGSNGNTGINTSQYGTGNGVQSAAVVASVTSTTITLNGYNGNGTWTSGGVVTLLSR